METLLSYAPRDFLMFGPEVYWRLFELQNRALWPLPAIAAMIAILALALVATRHPLAIRAVLLLAALACLGAAHFIASRYAPINGPVIYASWGFGLQAALLALFALSGRGSRSVNGGRAAALVGMGLVAHATILHPLSGLAFGRPLAQAEIVGIAPDPTAIACLGLLCIPRAGPWGIACSAFPFLWCAANAATLLTLGDPQGWILMAALLFWTSAQAMKVLGRI